jgi:hypothetical protein
MGGRVVANRREGGTPSRINHHLFRAPACIGLFFVVR